MNTTTIARAREQTFDGFEFCDRCHQGMSCGFAKPRKCLLVNKPAHLAADLEARAIAMLDDDQLWATFYRWRTVLRGETAARSLREKLSVSEYIDAIFSSVPE